MNDILAVSIVLLGMLLLLSGFALGRLSHRRELRYLRNFKENRDRLDRITRTINA